MKVEFIFEEKKCICISMKTLNEIQERLTEETKSIVYMNIIGDHIAHDFLIKQFTKIEREDNGNRSKTASNKSRNKHKVKTTRSSSK